MNVTLTLEDEVVRKVRRIAAERHTTLTGLVRQYLVKLSHPTYGIHFYDGLLVASAVCVDGAPKLDSVRLEMLKYSLD